MNNNIFFIFCHQDDEFGLFNVIEKATKKQKNVFVIYLTSGLKTKNQNSKNKQLQRDKESLKVLLKLGVSRNKQFLNFYINYTLEHLIFYLKKIILIIFQILVINPLKHLIILIIRAMLMYSSH